MNFLSQGVVPVAKVALPIQEVLDFRHSLASVEVLDGYNPTGPGTIRASPSFLCEHVRLEGKIYKSAPELGMQTPPGVLVAKVFWV